MVEMHGGSVRNETEPSIAAAFQVSTQFSFAKQMYFHGFVLGSFSVGRANFYNTYQTEVVVVIKTPNRKVQMQLI